MNIGILTYHRANNYGAYLQAYALCNRLNQEKDIEAEIIDFRMKKEAVKYQLPKSFKWRLLHRDHYKFLLKQRKAFAVSRAQLNCSDSFCQSDRIEDFKRQVYKKYDIIIAGSDEIWKVDGFRGFPTPYWLIGDLGCRKFSYAASARVSFSNLTKENQEALKGALKEFEIVSVRDKDTYKEVVKYCENPEKVLLSCDPSFLFDFKADKERGRALLKERYHINTDKKIIALMTEEKEIALKVLRQYHKDSELISLFHWNRGYHNLGDLTPFEWMDVIAGADFIFTSYFHGTCFSIINNTPFLALGTNQKSSKLKELLEGTICEDRYIENTKEFFKDKQWKKTVDDKSKGQDFSPLVFKQQEGFLEYLKYLL